ncbi:hypothetical protein [Mesorhizobium caraganae]|uniref:hypothetical protein n=1 Tax=Mesorhizobium caraganae TaxID=483206 RepID=UPI0033382638
MSHSHWSLALPLIVLPDISPRIVTGRKTLSSMFPLNFNVATRPELLPSPRPYTGRRCWQADEGRRERLTGRSDPQANSGAQSFQERKAA